MEDATTTTKDSQLEVVVEKTQDTPKITKEKTTKEKDPRRVAQGKKLAAISKQAKERKARETLQAEIDANAWDYGTLFGILGVILYYQIVERKPTTHKNGLGGHGAEAPVEKMEKKVEPEPERKKSLESLD